MVLYFTGTGNSRHIAERIAHALNDTLISLNDRIKSGDITPLAVNGRLVLVMPTYAWRIPRIVRDHLLRTELRGARETWFVMDCGSEIGNAAKYNRALCREKGLVYMGTAQIVMPENFIAMFNAPTVEEARRIIAKAEPFIDRAIAAIRAGHMFSPPRKKLYDRIASSAVNPVFYPLFVKANPFTAHPSRVPIPYKYRSNSKRVAKTLHLLRPICAKVHRLPLLSAGWHPTTCCPPRWHPCRSHSRRCGCSGSAHTLCRWR